MKSTVLIIGAGPAGLTSGLLLAREGHQVHIYESNPHYVGGLSRTEVYNGYRFDIGGHRFFTKEQEVEDFWNSVLGNDFLTRQRLSRIYYKGRFLNYPLKISDILVKLSFLENINFLFSFTKSKLFPPKNTDHLENWVISRFGYKLYETFFKSYTEKVWGQKCHTISTDWAAQRINNLSITEVFKSAIKPLFGKKTTESKSLIQAFQYPKYGPGMLWDKVKLEIEALGGYVNLRHNVVNSTLTDHQGWQLTFSNGSTSPTGEHLISTAPLRSFLQSLRPNVPEGISDSLSHFRYRGFITVALMFQNDESFPDNWIYIHEPNVKVARIQNYKNWSEWMTPGKDCVCYGLEYFCQENDSFWNLSDEELFKIAVSEIEQLNLPFSKQGLSFKVIRSPKAYPIYDLEYKERLDIIKSFIESKNNLHLIGRSGLHRYNNQDHSIKTAMLAVENIKKGHKVYSPWNVNQDAEYIESK